MRLEYDCRLPQPSHSHVPDLLHNTSDWKGLTLRLSLQIRRCHNSSCIRFLAPYRPEAEGRIAFPNQKLSLPLLSHVSSIHDRCRTIRKTQARLSGGGINLAHATVEKAVKLTQRFRKTEPLEDVREFLQTHPHQKYVLLDIFSWRRSYGDHSGWMARDCLSGDVVAQPTLKLVHALWSVFPASDSYSRRAVTHEQYCCHPDSQRPPASTLRQFPLPQALSVLPKELLRDARPSCLLRAASPDSVSLGSRSTITGLLTEFNQYPAA